MFLRCLILCLLVLFNTGLTFSQTPADYWYFGVNAGLNFTIAGPVALTDGELVTWEGCTAFSDESGNLLFYSDGTYVWNKEHEVMPHGNDLMGDFSSSQSAIIVPKPNSLNLYYIFTVDAVENELANGMRYSLVDMSLDNGLGDIVVNEKNIIVLPLSCEKVSAVEHGSLEAFWIIGHRWNSNAFYAFMVSEDGVDLNNPAISYSGEIINGHRANAIGYLKVSPDGKKLAKANQVRNTIEIFDFNDLTGEVSNAILDDDFTQSTYGLEFSTNSKFLYVGEFIGLSEGNIFQYDLTAGSPQEILDSRQKIAHTGYRVEALQLAPDNKIYVASTFREYLGRINKPDSLGLLCDYESDAVFLESRQSGAGLPPFIQSIFKLEADFFFTNSCFGQPTYFFEDCSRNPDSVLWDFGDPASGINNTSTLFNPSHSFTNPGVFQVSLTAHFRDIQDMTIKWITVNELPEINLGPDSTFCENNQFILNAGAGFQHYLWNTGDTIPSIVTDTAGLFWVEVTSTHDCSNRDTILLSLHSSFNIQDSISICSGDSAFLQGEYRKEGGLYYDTLLSVFYCDSILETRLILNDTFLINQYHEICQGDSVFLGGDWQTQSGNYSDLFISQHGCDSIILTGLLVTDIIHFNTDTFICNGDSVYLGGHYQIQEGYYYDTSQSVSGCDSVVITWLHINEIYETIIDTGICQGDSLFAGSEYQTEEGIYYDNYLSSEGCDSIKITNLLIQESYYVEIDTGICTGDSIFLENDYRKTPGVYLDIHLSIYDCDSIVQTLLSIIPVPNIDLGPDIMLNPGEELLLNPEYTFPAYYLWQDGSTDSLFVVHSTGAYYVSVYNYCGTDSDTIIITYILYPDNDCNVILPNAFTPDGDGLNDLFLPVFDCENPDYVLRIFDRWGKLIFESSENNTGWDGKIKNSIAKPGTYVWLLEYNHQGNGKFKNQFSGTVIVLIH